MASRKVCSPEVVPSADALLAFKASDSWFDGNTISDLEPLDVCAHFKNLATAFVTEDDIVGNIAVTNPSALPEMYFTEKPSVSSPPAGSLPPGSPAADTWRALTSAFILPRKRVFLCYAPVERMCTMLIKEQLVRIKQAKRRICTRCPGCKSGTEPLQGKLRDLW